MITSLDGSYVYLIIHCLNKNENVSDIIKNLNDNIKIVYQTDFCVNVAAEKQEYLDGLIEKYENNKNVSLIYDRSHPKSINNLYKPCVKYEAYDNIYNNVNQTYTAKQLAQIYQFPIPNNNPKNIAVIEIQGSVNTSDIYNYWGNYCNIPTNYFPQINLVSIDGQSTNPSDPSNNSDTNFEATLDVSNVGAACTNPNTTITMYNCQNTQMSVYNTIVTILNSPVIPNAISFSYTTKETDYPSISYIEPIEQLFEKLVSMGVNFFASTGDEGALNGGTAPSVNYPASSPNVVACGGSSLSCPNLQYNDPATIELVYYDTADSNGSGGGISMFFPQPSYQKNVVPIEFSSGRAIPDISLQAGAANYSGIVQIVAQLLIFNGTLYVAYGTSCVAPLMAGFVAAAGINKFINPYIYSLYLTNRIDFNDIDVGNNGYYEARSGYDCCTGLGSINGINLACDLIQSISGSSPSYCSNPCSCYESLLTTCKNSLNKTQESLEYYKNAYENTKNSLNSCDLTLAKIQESLNYYKNAYNTSQSTITSLQESLNYYKNAYNTSQSTITSLQESLSNVQNSYNISTVSLKSTEQMLEYYKNLYNNAQNSINNCQASLNKYISSYQNTEVSSKLYKQLFEYYKSLYNYQLSITDNS
jgi:exonuclease VII small subunit